MKIRHQLLDDGRVLLSFVGGSPMSARVESAEAKRLAWALLNDLDPDGCMEFEPPEARACYDTIKRDRMAGGEQMRMICDFLAKRGEVNTREIAAHIQTNGSHAAVQMGRMAKIGLVTRLTEGRSCAPSIWTLGPVTMEQWVRRVPALPRAA